MKRLVRAASCWAAVSAIALVNIPCAQAEDLAHGRWVVDVGLALRGRPTHIGSERYTTDLLPILDASWGKRVQISLDDGARWTAIRAGPLSLGPVAEYRQSYNNQLPPRSRRLSDAVELGGFAQLTLTYAVLEGRLRKAVTGYEGLSGDVSLGTRIALGSSLSLGVEARSSWADRRYGGLLFAPSSSAQPLATPPTGNRDYFTAGVQTGLVWQFKPNWTAALGASEDRIVSPTSARSVRSRRDIATVGLSLTRQFAWGGGP